MKEPAYTNADLKDLPSFREMVGPKPPNDFVSNGVTCGPDRVFGVDLRPAAHWHDFAYGLGGDERTRYFDDLRFNENCKRCGLRGPAYGWLRMFIYYRLRFWGHFRYTYYAHQEPRRGVWFWLRLFFGRYL